MEKLIPIGRAFFALAFIGLGINHFMLQDFITGRAPAWPQQFSGKLIWAYFSGAVFITISIFILSGKKARLAAIIAGLLIFIWALLRNIPIVATDSILSPSWTITGKSLVFFSGPLVIAGTLPKVGNHGTPLLKFINLKSEFIVLGRICLRVFMMITGIQHFIYTKFVASLIPLWFPGDSVFWTYFGGAVLFSGGLGLLIPLTAKCAALLSGLMVFLWFWIIHIPRTFLSVSDGIAVFEALAVSCIAFVLAGYGESKIRLTKPFGTLLLICTLFLISLPVYGNNYIKMNSDGAGISAQDSLFQRDGQHDFDFEIGKWKTDLRRLQNPLSGSTTWLEYEGISVVSKVWDGRANLVELAADGSAGHIEALSLRLYNPETRQWSLNFASSRSGVLSPPMLGEFKNGRGEFYNQETFNGRAIFVRFIITKITSDSCRFEQSFSDDGGKTWEVNWIAVDTRIKD